MQVKAKDTVVVLSGKSKGQRGTVLSVDPKAGKALVEGVNVVWKHARANPRLGVKGGRMEREALIDASNLMVVCPKCGKPTRPKSIVTTQGERIRSCRHDGCAAPLSSK